MNAANAANYGARMGSAAQGDPAGTAAASALAIILLGALGSQFLTPCGG